MVPTVPAPSMSMLAPGSRGADPRNVTTVTRTTAACCRSNVRALSIQ